MEFSFENRYVGNYKMLAEFGRKYSKGRRVQLCACIVIYIYFVLKSWWNDILLEMIPTLLIVGLVYGALYFVPHYNAWATVRNAKKHNDGVLPEMVVTFGDAIEIHEGMTRITFEYQKIQKVVRLKHSYVLMNGKHGGLLLDPNGFTKGTFEEFKQFLREKRPDLKIPE